MNRDEDTPARMVLALLPYTEYGDTIALRLEDVKVNPNRLGTAIRLLAEDLVAERRRVLLLEREVRELKAQVAALESSARHPSSITQAG